MDERNVWMIGFFVATGIGLVTSLRASKALLKLEELERRFMNAQCAQEHQMSRVQSELRSDVEQLRRTIGRGHVDVDRMLKRIDALYLEGGRTSDA